MDKIDAKSFIKKLKEIENFKGKVIVISNNKSIKTKKELLSMGFDLVVYTPIDKKELENKLKTN